jgi:iron only hydrogenase large subunit-like protein
MSTCKSPQAMVAALIKVRSLNSCFPLTRPLLQTYFASKIGKKPEEIYSVSIMPCTAKKDEIIRNDMGRFGYRDVGNI